MKKRLSANTQIWETCYCSRGSIIVAIVFTLPSILGKQNLWVIFQVALAWKWCTSLCCSLSKIVRHVIFHYILWSKYLGMDVLKKLWKHILRYYIKLSKFPGYFCGKEIPYKQRSFPEYFIYRKWTFMRNLCIFYFNKRFILSEK